MVCGMAEAYAKALEHNLLLKIITQGIDDDEAEVGGGARDGKGPFRFNETEGYEVLPVARVKTASLDVRSHPIAVPIIANVLPKVCGACLHGSGQYCSPHDILRAA